MKKLLAISLVLCLMFTSHFSFLALADGEDVNINVGAATPQIVTETVMQSDFDNSDGTNWQGTKTDVVQFMDENGDSVNDYARVNSHEKTKGVGLVSSPFELIPGTEYELSFEIRIPADSNSYLISGKTFYAPNFFIYEPKLNTSGTKVSSAPQIADTSSANNLYAYSYTDNNKEDENGDTSFKRRPTFSAEWQVGTYAPYTKTKYSHFAYTDHKKLLGSTTDSKTAYSEWTTVTAKFTAVADEDGEISQTAAVCFNFQELNGVGYMFDVKNVKLVSKKEIKQNYILTSDFNDADGTNWQATPHQTVTFSDDNGDGVNDYASVKISPTKNGAGLVSSPFNLIPGNEYELTYYIRVPEGSESFNIGGTFYAPTTAFYQPKVNDAGTKVSNTPAVSTEEASNNYYAYSYTDKDDATKNWVRREGFKSTWTFDGYEPTVKSKYSSFGYIDHGSVLSATNADLNAAFANWTKVTVNFTAMAAVEGETSQVTALAFTFHDYMSDKNYVFDIKDVVLTETSLQPETPEQPEEPGKPEGAVFYEGFENATDASVAKLITNCSWAKPKVVSSEYYLGSKALALKAYWEYMFIPVDKAKLTPGTIYEFSMDWKLKELTDTDNRGIELVAFVGYNPSQDEKIGKETVKTGKGVYTYKQSISATGNWEHATLLFGNSQYDTYEQYGILLRYSATDNPYDDDDTLYVDNVAIAPAAEKTTQKIDLKEQPRTDDTIKVLAFGNSFSNDSLTWISEIAQADGKDLRVGNCVIGGCALMRHYNNMFNGDDDKYSFTYYTIEKKKSQKVSMQEALAATDWDYITIQQVSQNSGRYETFEPYLSELIAYFKKMCPNAKIVLHASWAYSKDSTHSGFANYGKDQETMHNAIQDAYITASKNYGYLRIIPTGEAIKRARATSMGDNLNRDGFHLNDRGRLIAALTWYETFTGISALDTKVDLTNNEIFKITAPTEGTDEQTGDPVNVTKEEALIMKTSAHEAAALFKLVYEAQHAVEDIDKVITVKSGDKIKRAEALREELNNDTFLPNYATLESAKAEYNSRLEKIVFPGDIDHNYEEPDAQDITLLAKYFAGWNVKDTVNSKALDVNGDGKENLYDLVVLAQYVAEWENVKLYDPNMEEIKGLVDFVIEAPSGKDVRILQLTDTQIIDESKARYNGRFKDKTYPYPKLSNDDAYNRCFKYIKESVEQSNPDLILITGDFIYGEFDDDGEWFSKLVLYMNSLEIPWAPVFGNHDNESKKGVTWQCNMFEKFEENYAEFQGAFSEFKNESSDGFKKFKDLDLSDMKNYCLFKRGDITGNGNYSIGIVQDKQLIKTVYMMDTNACKYAYSDDRIIDENGKTVTIKYNEGEVDENGEKTIKTNTGFGDDQVEWLNTNSAKIDATLGYTVTKFLGIHIQLKQYWYAAIESGYENSTVSNNEEYYTIGETVPAKNGDFGTKGEKFNGVHGDEELWQILKDNNFDGIFAGHTHKNSTSILYDGIRLTFGLKTGRFDGHSKASLGGTQITLNGNGFNVEHVYVK